MYRARAPLRLSFSGGGTDVSPYCDLYGGAVLNATINKFAYVSIRETDDSAIRIRSRESDTEVKFGAGDEIVFDGSCDLAKAVYRRFGPKDQGLVIETHNDAPPGSGLGSSSAMVVALIQAFAEYSNTPLSRYDIANAAYEIERLELLQLGGRQDQYASAFGGFNFIEFDEERTIVHPLRIDPWTLYEIEYHLILVYTRKSRLSSGIIESQIENVKNERESNIDAMHELRVHAVKMKDALLTGETERFGTLLGQAWKKKKRMAAAITNDRIDELYEEAIRAGALGGKISGAGGGGFMMLYCAEGRKLDVVERMKALGVEVVDFHFELSKATAWRSSWPGAQPTQAISRCSS